MKIDIVFRHTFIQFVYCFCLPLTERDSSFTISPSPTTRFYICMLLHAFLCFILSFEPRYPVTFPFKRCCDIYDTLDGNENIKCFWSDASNKGFSYSFYQYFIMFTLKGISHCAWLCVIITL